MSVQKSKSTIRRELLKIRVAMDVAGWESASRTIAGKVLEIPEVIDAAGVMLYLSMQERREVDTAFLIRGLTEAGNKNLFVPLTDGKNLSVAPFEEGDQLVPGRFGQPEPVSGKSCNEPRFDVVILPAVAVDRRGSRLGYGKGYYDRFLAGLERKERKPFVLALAFSFQLVEVLPDDPWDETLDCLVTEKEVLKFQ